MEVIPVSLSDPWSSLAVEDTARGLIFYLSILAFCALLITAIWIQAKKYLTR